MPNKPSLLDDLGFEHVWDTIYMGDDKAQNAAIATIEDGIKEPGKIYIVYGPVRSGKNNVYQAVKRAHKKDTGMFFSEDQRHMKASETIHNVVRLTEDIAASDESVGLSNLAICVEQAQALIQAHPNTSVVLDVFSLGETVIPSLMSSQRKAKQSEENAILKRLQAANPNIVLCKTRYSPTQTRRALWDLHELVSQTHSDVAEGIKRYWFDEKHIPHAAINELVAALSRSDKQAYTAAFIHACKGPSSPTQSAQL